MVSVAGRGVYLLTQNRDAAQHPVLEHSCEYAPPPSSARPPPFMSAQKNYKLFVAAHLPGLRSLDFR